MMPRAAILILATMVAFSGCARSQPVASEPDDRQLDQLNAAAWTAFDAGEYSLAARMFSRALDRAHVRDDADAAADAAYNAAAAHTRAREFDQALRRLDDASRVQWGASSRRTESIDRLTVAVLIELDRLDDAEAGIEQAMNRDGLSPGARRAISVLRADIAIRKNDRETADRMISSIGPPNEGRAGELVVYGRYSSMTGDADTAAIRFERAADLYRDANRYDAMARSLAHAAEAHAVMGNHGTAASLWTRASRSAKLQGLDEWADEWSAKARSVDGSPSKADD